MQGPVADIVLGLTFFVMFIGLVGIVLPALPGSLAGAVERTIEEHLAASLPASIDGEYVGTHWLASFALLAIDGA